MAGAAYKAFIDYVKPTTPVACDWCDWTGTFAEVNDIVQCVLTPGDPSPAGRCPRCDALAYITEGAPDAR